MLLLLLLVLELVDGDERDDIMVDDDDHNDKKNVGIDLQRSNIPLNAVWGFFLNCFENFCVHV
jgi:hypothetical protein